MANTDVKLSYISDGAAKFISDADNATNSVTKLNLALADIKGTTLKKNLLEARKGTDGLNKSFSDSNSKIPKMITLSKELADVLKVDSRETRAFKKEMDGVPPKVQQSVKSITKFSEVIIRDEGKRKNFNTFLIQLVKNFSKIPAPVLGATAALAGFKIASFVLEKIGDRAAGLDAVSESFERLRKNAGLSSEFISEFAESSDNTLKQSELLIKSNQALAGSSGEFAKELGESLPLLLEFARARSAATGEDIDFLFESAITGIKKAQPLILDNLGLVVDLNQVYEDYAATLGKTKDQLTGVEQQQAILNSVNQEAKRNIDILGEASLSNADKILARGNIYSDILDNISLAVQPLLGLFLDVEIFFAKLIGETLQPLIDIVSSVVNIFSQFGQLIFNFLKPVLEFLFELIQAILAPFVQILRVVQRLTEVFTGLFNSLNVIKAVFSPLIGILELVGVLFKTIADVVIGVIDGITFLFREVGKVVGQFNVFQKVGEAINKRLQETKELVVNLGKALVYGLGRAFASLVNTAAKAARDILRVVANLAQGIADFLIGQSPPPRGPLSKIDTGGKKTFEAFLDGFTSVSLRPIQMVAKQVDQDLGKIGSFSLAQVTQRLGQLDLAIRPFNEQLQIAQSRFEAISEPAEAALRAIDRQLDTAVQALTKGDASAKASVQTLDAQRAAIHKNLELQQQQVDFAQIELALAKSKQVEERTLLEIQKKRLGGEKLSPIEKELAQKIASKSPSSTAAKTGGSGSTSGAESFESVTQGGAETGSEFGNLFLDGFGDAINLGLFEEIGTEQDRLITEGARIGEGLNGLGDRLFSPFEDVFGANGSIANLFSDIFGDEGIIRTSIDGLFGDDGFIKQRLDSVGGFFTDSFNNISTNFNNTFGEGSSLRNNVSGFVSQMESDFTDFLGSDSILANLINGMFGEEGTFTVALTSFFGEDGRLSTMLTSAQSIFTNFQTVANEEIALINDALSGENSFLSILQYLFNEEDGRVKILTDAGIELFTGFYNSIFGEDGVLRGVATAIQTLIVAPFLTLLSGIQGAINGVISYMETMVNNILTGLGDIIEAIPENLRGPLSNLTGLAVEFQRVDFQLPEINVQGAAKGGLFTGGMLEVGERGREFITSADKMAVFPNNFVNAIESLENTLVQAMYIPSSGNIRNSNVTNNNQRTNNFNFSGNADNTTVRQQFNQFAGG